MIMSNRHLVGAGLHGWGHVVVRFRLQRNGVRAGLLLTCLTLHFAGSPASVMTAPNVRTVDRRLKAVDLPVGNGSEGWTLGRAGFAGPPDVFIQAFNDTR